jgi:two-component system KDP operon response regulator KdpE
MDLKTVLVVDDEPALRLLCRVNLELEGHRVLEASTLTEARELIATELPDVVLLDVHLGNERGLDLIDDIDSRESATRIVLLSGSSEISPELRAQVAGVLGKPFDLAELTAAVTSVHVS